ncbi:PREDICTED: pentatricopeptide repeat-containing protein At3g58590-like [Erythranthe guttata]|uniref:pentatricopeptide repeat-containing protein At3g58590-like n=1 Tax=Erythranthe guttata TaxID=4155 RepID=UPI00064E0DCF|nr:PREDICTED: pentatricopeptide repeat-containing protein At3g58590-like [Erythranthe guttata]|eukprot:XP_012846879.1 PREDICTED: pentatricopeptide repeat-containing protein At3g58590-like [Erythranthe guttata]
MYAICVTTSSAEKMFESAHVKDVVSWNALIGSMANSVRPIRALDFFLKMCRTGLSPNERTFTNEFTACSRLQLLSCGECFHANFIKKRYKSDVYSGTVLVNFYSKYDKPQEARVCFDRITQKNTVSWNSLMLGYSSMGSSFSVTLLQEMIQSGYHPNELSFSIVIKSSLKTELLHLHSLTIKNGYHENCYVSSSLISSYARNGLVSEALTFVGSAQTKSSVVSSNIIAWIYNRTGLYEKAQEFYADIENPDAEVLFSHILKTYYELRDTFVSSTMIDMYGKCGSIESSIKIFYETTRKNIISWTALISTLGLHGYANEVMERFGEMVKMGIEPDKLAFLSVLSACRHGGLVKQGTNLYREMKVKYGVEPDIDHYVLVVDLLTRYGHIKEAEQVILGMPIAPNALIWRGFVDGSIVAFELRIAIKIIIIFMAFVKICNDGDGDGNGNDDDDFNGIGIVVLEVRSVVGSSSSDKRE